MRAWRVTRSLTSKALPAGRGAGDGVGVRFAMTSSGQLHEESIGRLIDDPHPDRAARIADHQVVAFTGPLARHRPEPVVRLPGPDRGGAAGLQLDALARPPRQRDVRILRLEHRAGGAVLFEHVDPGAAR